ncbi:hypothetical protein [Yoonia sp.]|uniref:hypothetical protein n=1 Tax=Yoonia sp. TaxID=2212373 RepID=UPI0023B6EBB9
MNAVILRERPYIIPLIRGKEPTYIEQNNELGRVMWRLIKALLFLIILAGGGFVAYAYVGPLFFPADFAAPSQEVTQPVTLDTN